MADPRFPPVELISGWAPNDQTQYLPNIPQHQPAQIPRPNQGSGAPSTQISGSPAPTPIAVDPHHYAFLSDLVTAAPDFTAGVPAFLFLQQPPFRRNLLILRNSSGIGGPALFIAFGTPANPNSTLELAAATATAPGQTAMFDDVVPQNDVYVIANGAGGQLSYAYGNISG